MPLTHLGFFLQLFPNFTTLVVMVLSGSWKIVVWISVGVSHEAAHVALVALVDLHVDAHTSVPANGEQETGNGQKGSRSVSCDRRT